MKDIKLDIAYLGIIFIAFTLPFSVLINNIAIILSFLPILITLLIDKPKRNILISNIKANKIALYLLAFAGLNVISGFIHLHSYNSLSVLFSDIEKRTVFLIIPLVFAITPMLTKTQIRNIFISFMVGLVLSMTISLIAAGYVSIITKSIINLHAQYNMVENNFMYHRLGSYLDLHAVYYSCMVLMGLIMTLVYSRYRFRSSTKVQKGLMILVLTYFLVMLFLLKSVVMLISLMLVIAIFGLAYLYRVRKTIAVLRISIAIIGLTVLFSTLSYRVVEKVGNRGNFFDYDFTEPGGGQWNVFNLRKAKWDVASEAIADHWLIGVGPGKIYEVLDEYYKKHNFNFALNEHYNPHNQFLHSFLTLGIVGFFVLASIYFLAFKQAIQKTDMVWCLFMIGFTLFSMSESTLAVNKGIIFFVFFTTLFSYLPLRSSSYFNE